MLAIVANNISYKMYSYVHDISRAIFHMSDSNCLLFTHVCILPSKTQHMYINTVMKYQLHQGYMFRP